MSSISLSTLNHSCTGRCEFTLRVTSGASQVLLASVSGLKHFAKICYNLIIQSVKKGDLDEVSSALEHVRVKTWAQDFSGRYRVQTQTLKKISSPIPISPNRMLAKKIQYHVHN